MPLRVATIAVRAPLRPWNERDRASERFFATLRSMSVAASGGGGANGGGARIVDDRYELGSVIGRGGHGVVYQAIDRETGGQVALKFLHDSVAVDPQYNIRMLREAQVMAALAGTSAIRVY